MMESMRSTRALLAFAMVMLLGLSAAWAQAGDSVAQAAAAAGETGAPAAQADQGDTDMRQPERLLQKPSGFWTSGRPAVGGAYRYRLLAIGTGVMIATAILMVWVVRRHPRRNA